MENITLRISKKLKQELIQIAHQKGMVLNEYLNILLVNKILKIYAKTQRKSQQNNHRSKRAV